MALILENDQLFELADEDCDFEADGFWANDDNDEGEETFFEYVEVDEDEFDVDAE